MRRAEHWRASWNGAVCASYGLVSRWVAVGYTETVRRLAFWKASLPASDQHGDTLRGSSCREARRTDAARSRGPNQAGGRSRDAPGRDQGAWLALPFRLVTWHSRSELGPEQTVSTLAERVRVRRKDLMAGYLG